MATVPFFTQQTYAVGSYTQSATVPNGVHHADFIIDLGQMPSAAQTVHFVAKQNGNTRVDFMAQGGTDKFGNPAQPSLGAAFNMNPGDQITLEMTVVGASVTATASGTLT